jgi:hypothetical protein
VLWASTGERDRRRVRTGVGSGELLLLVSWCARERGEEQGRRWQAAAAWRPSWAGVAWRAGQRPGAGSRGRAGRARGRREERKEGEGNGERGGAGFAPTRCDPGRPRATVARKQAGFAAWSTAGRPRARRAERRMGQRVFGKEK